MAWLGPERCSMPSSLSQRDPPRETNGTRGTNYFALEMAAAWLAQTVDFLTVCSRYLRWSVNALRHRSGHGPMFSVSWGLAGSLLGLKQKGARVQQGAIGIRPGTKRKQEKTDQ